MHFALVNHFELTGIPEPISSLRLFQLLLRVEERSLIRSMDRERILRPCSKTTKLVIFLIVVTEIVGKFYTRKAV